MTTARVKFIDRLHEHFNGGRRPSESALGDLERELVADGYTDQVLDRAARDMIRTRYVKSFPSVAECLAACRVAEEQVCGGRGITDSDTEAAPATSAQAHRFETDSGNASPQPVVSESGQREVAA